MLRALLLLVSLTVALPALAQSARELNAEGFRLYKAGQLPQALEKFQAAAQADPKYALAHYNVAATLGVLRKQGQVCQFDAYRETIVERLNTAVKLDPKRLARAREDTDLDPIRDTLGWQRLLGRSPARAADVPELLRRVSWFGPGVGVYGTTRALRFQDGGRVVLQRKTFDNPEGMPRDEEVSGTYSVKGRALELRLPGMKPLKGTLTVRGALQVDELGTFTDSPSECEA
jgi:tetratricopeptide (TPR) repeat protein